MTENQTFKITSCPFCNESHNYKIAVKRSHVIKMLTPNDMRERPVPKSFTRFFICPNSQNKFQATIKLFDSSSHKIESVDVIGISNEQE